MSRCYAPALEGTKKLGVMLPGVPPAAVNAEVLNALADLLQDHHVGGGFFVAIIVSRYELDCDLHRSRPPVWVTPVGWLMLR